MNAARLRSVLSTGTPDAYVVTPYDPALNGNRLAATLAQATAAVLSLTTGELDEAEFAGWLRTHLVTRKK